MAAATDGGKCAKLPLCPSLLSVVAAAVSVAGGDTANRDSTSFRVKIGRSWFFLFPLIIELAFLLLFNL